MWKGIATPFRSTKHTVIIPDLLGYDGTDKPTDPTEYKWDSMTTDLIEIINEEKVDKVISIGHDWGSVCASRLYNYYPDRVVGLVLLNVGYLAPGREPFDLDTATKMTEQAFGYPIFSYWYLFAAEDGPAILKANLERLYPALHGAGDAMKRYFTVPNAMREYLTNGGDEIELRSYAKDANFRQAFIDRMSRDGFEGPQCWYRATVEQKQYEADKNLPKSADKVEVPVLYFGAKGDAICRPEAMYEYIQAGMLPKLEQAEMIDAGHWVPYEAPDKVVDGVEQWLKKHFAQ